MAEVRGSELLREFTMQVFHVPTEMEDVNGSSCAMALIVLRRQDGFLLALPTDVLAPAVLTAGLSASPVDQVGMSTTISVPAGVLADFNAALPPEPTQGDLVDVLLVDVSGDLLQLVEPYTQTKVDADLIHPFSFADPSLVPLPEELVQQAWDWVQDPSSAGLNVFYSAEEEEVVPEMPAAVGTSPASAAAKRLPKARAPLPGGGGGGAKQPATQKKPTVAQLAVSLEQVTSTLPQVVQQLQRMSERQDALEAHMHKEVSRPSALQQPLGGSAMTGSQRVSFNPRTLIQEFPAPKSMSTGGNPPLGHISSRAVECGAWSRRR